ncbi:hypothetical protein ACWDA3_34200 [Nonomuraea rubra]
MYKQGLILAGLVGGLLMSGGAALADDEVEASATHSSARSLEVCAIGDAIFAQGDVDKGTEGVLVLEVGDVLSQILGIKKEENNCTIG